MCSELLILGDPGPVGQELKKDDGCQVRHKMIQKLLYRWKARKGILLIDHKSSNLIIVDRETTTFMERLQRG